MSKTIANLLIATVAFFSILTAIAGWLRPSQNPGDYRSGTAHSCIDGKSTYRAIPRTSTALHTHISIDNMGFSCFDLEYMMRAHEGAYAATGA